MSTTKSNILARLKRSGGSSVEELASGIGLARMTVRQHLATLERDGLVESREVRRATGRPHFVYRLTDRGEETFPKRYDRLAGLILEEVSLLDGEELAGLSPAEKKRLLLDRMASRLLKEHEGQLRGRTLTERVEAVTRILDDEGGFAEWRSREDGYEISDYNCVYRRVANSDDEVCRWHLAVLGQLLGSDVECTQYMSAGAESCRFIVQAGDGAPASAATATSKERED